MTDAYLMDADCVHGVPWYECKECEQPEPDPLSLTDQVDDDPARTRDEQPFGILGDGNPECLTTRSCLNHGTPMEGSTMVFDQHTRGAQEARIGVNA